MVDNIILLEIKSMTYTFFITNVKSTHKSNHRQKLSHPLHSLIQHKAINFIALKSIIIMHPQISEIGPFLMFRIIMLNFPKCHLFHKRRPIIINEVDIIMFPEPSVKHLKNDKVVNPHAFYTFTELIYMRTGM